MTDTEISNRSLLSILNNYKNLEKIEELYFDGILRVNIDCGITNQSSKDIKENLRKFTNLKIVAFPSKIFYYRR